MDRVKVHIQLSCILALAMAMSADVASQHRFLKRDASQDSIAWVKQTIPLPGVIAGNAVWFDYDNDGRLDILMAGESDLGPVSGVYRNDSVTGFVNVQANICTVVSERGLAWGDFNNDGNYDFAIEGRNDTSAGPPIAKIYRNDGGSFTDIQAPLLGLTGGSVNWVDFDNDGRLDLNISGSPDMGRSFATKIYRNIKGEFFEEPIFLPGVWGSSVAWADYDGDGYQDVLISGYGYGVQTRLYHNAMAGGVIGFDEVYAPVDSAYPFQAVNSSGVLWFDYDNDGGPDLLITGVAPGNIPVAKIYHNNRNGSFTDIKAALKGESVSAVAVGDYDNDGYLDLAISGTDDFLTGSNPTTKIYHNNQDGTFTDIGAPLVGTWFGSLEWGDYDKDGRLDLLVTGATLPRQVSPWGYDTKPITTIYRNTVAVDSNTAPSAPAALIAQSAVNTVRFTWTPASDQETDQKALTYNLRVGTAPGGIDVVSPLSNVTSGYRRAPKTGNMGAQTEATLRDLAPGTYFWSVQAIDHEYTGSRFATEGTFTVSTSAVSGQISPPATFELAQNYPNPFNPSTTIAYTLPAGGVVSLKVYDVLGHEVSTLVSGWNDAGSHTVRWNGERCASGVYCYRLQFGSHTEARTMVLLR